jgi:hypothetical protein
VLPPPHPAQQRDSDLNRDIGINAFDIEKEQRKERLENQSLIASFPFPAERFADINEADLTSFDSSRNVFKQPFQSRQVLPTRTEKETKEKITKQFSLRQNLVQLEEPRSSSDLLFPDFRGRSLFDKFPYPSVSESNTKDISNPAQSLFFGSPSSNINMEDGSYTIVTFFG